MATDDESRGGWSEPPAGVPPAPAAPGGGAPRYVLGAFVGRGGMGAVHSARDGRLARDVALKVARPDGAGAHLLWREACIAGRLDHLAVVAVHDVGRLPDGRPFYAMRLVRGRSLAQRLDDGEAREPAGRRALIRHVLPACEAVGSAHQVGLVHRDLKPANVLVGPHGETQVVDWGLAAPTPAAAARWADLAGPRPAAGGSPGFTAPEQAAGADPDPRHDVWSLGALLAAVAGAPDGPLKAIIERAQAEPPQARYPDGGRWRRIWPAGSRGSGSRRCATAPWTGPAGPGGRGGCRWWWAASGPPCWRWRWGWAGGRRRARGIARWRPRGRRGGRCAA